MKEFNPLFYCDFYKTSHRQQYPEGTQLVYSNFTPRKSRIEGIDKMVFFGLQYLIKDYLIRQFNENFFNKPKEEIVGEYRNLMVETVGDGNVDHIAELHGLGYLPIEIGALPEGTHVPMNVPAMTIFNTKPEFFWLTNYLETLISNIIWKPCTSATTAVRHRQILEQYAEETGAPKEFVDWQGHDFSFRGMSGIEDACMSGAGHLLSFTGTDTVPSINFLKEYYNGTGLIGGSVAASEHSVMCAGGEDDELETFRRLLEDVHPSGILSVVSDTWDLWEVLTSYLLQLKEIILKRHNGDPMNKLVIRPDSGTPHLIVNGNPNGKTEAERKGVIKLLDEAFGHTVNEKGYKVLHPTIGCIYGDGIDVSEMTRILDGIKENGYCTNAMVFGLGSFTYQYVTRDVFGTVCKSTYCIVNGVGRELYKDPVTGAWKKSHKGLLRVDRDTNGELFVTEQVDWKDRNGLMTPVFRDGKLLREESLDDIRKRIRQE